jgi:hypothetical protein
MAETETVELTEEEQLAQAAELLGLSEQELEMIRRLRGGEEVQPVNEAGGVRYDEDGYAVTMDQQKIYGPFRDYTMTTTIHGNYGIPAGQIMWFEDERVFNHKEKVWEIRPMPKYETVKIRDIRTQPLVLEGGKINREVELALLEYRDRRAEIEKRMAVAGVEVLVSDRPND